MESTTALPVRVYCPGEDWLATALAREGPNVVIQRDGTNGTLEYVQACSVVEIAEATDDNSQLKLIDGRVVMRGTTQLP